MIFALKLKVLNSGMTDIKPSTPETNVEDSRVQGHPWSQENLSFKKKVGLENWFRCKSTALIEDPSNLDSSTYVMCLAMPVTSASGDPAPSSGFSGHLHAGAHTHKQITHNLIETTTANPKDFFHLMVAWRFMLIILTLRSRGPGIAASSRLVGDNNEF